MRLPRSFFARPAAEVAPDLLGHVLCHRGPDGIQRARLVETEAYLGPHDLAAHTSRGRTPRTRTMFGPPGHCYVYFVYGMHHMLNIVTGDHDGQAVLLRGAEPLTPGLGRTDGPARLTRAMGITVAGLNGAPADGLALWFEEGIPPRHIEATPRIGVDYAGEWAARPLRFIDADSHWTTGRGGRPRRKP